MGFSLKKLGRGIKKIAKKNKGGFGRLVKKVGPGLALSLATGGVGAGVIAKAGSMAKSLGKKVRGLETPKSLAPIIRAANITVKKRSRSRMPGGAPMPTIGTPSIGMMSNRRQAKRTLYEKKPARRRRAATANGAPAPAKKKRVIKAPPSAKQLAQRERFKAMAAARRKAS